MKSNLELTGEDIADNGGADTVQLRGKPTSLSAKVVIPKNFRELKWNERVSPGDFVMNGQDLEPWEGPSGFQAHSFVRPIYRATKAGRSPVEKS